MYGTLQSYAVHKGARGIVLTIAHRLYMFFRYINQLVEVKIWHHHLPKITNIITASNLK